MPVIRSKHKPFKVRLKCSFLISGHCVFHPEQAVSWARACACPPRPTALGLDVLMHQITGLPATAAMCCKCLRPESYQNVLIVQAKKNGASSKLPPCWKEKWRLLFIRSNCYPTQIYVSQQLHNYFFLYFETHYLLMLHCGITSGITETSAYFIGY